MRRSSWKPHLVDDLAARPERPLTRAGGWMRSARTERRGGRQAGIGLFRDARRRFRRSASGTQSAEETRPLGLPATGRGSSGLHSKVAGMLLLSAAYYGTAVPSLHLALVRRQVTPIWPPTGIALVALLLFGRRLWPGITLGAFLVNLPISPSPVIALGIAAGNTLAPLFAATLLRKARFRPQLDRLRDAMAIVLLGALLGMTVSATGGTATLVLSGTIPRAAFLPTWSVWWAGDAMGVLIVAPF